MSDFEPREAYVYQPHPVTRKDGRLWQVGKMPDGLTREQAQAIVDIVNGTSRVRQYAGAEMDRQRPTGDARIEKAVNLIVIRLLEIGAAFPDLKVAREVIDGSIREAFGKESL